MPQTVVDPYPLKFRPIYKEKVWGGRALASLNRTLPGDNATAIGESWELADLDATAPTGGGGEPAHSVIANGPLKGQTIDAALREQPHILGKLPSADGRFPLLVKYLDARENLSVQVHPSPAYAAAHPQAHLKSEAWYIVDAAPGAAIYKGLAPGVTVDDLRRALAINTVEAVEPLLRKVPVKAGDCHYLPSGTCHALGAGIVVAEVQTPSDTTFRLFDWGREGRELHIDAALECIATAPPVDPAVEKRSHVAGIFTTVSRLVLCEHFRIEKVRMVESFEQEIPYDQPVVWMVLKGKGRISDGQKGKQFADVAFQAGETLLLPAGMEDARIALDQDTIWLDVTFPNVTPEPAN